MVRGAFLACLLAAGAGPGPLDPGCELCSAASRGDLARVEELLAAGVDANARSEYGATALSFAADKGHLGVMKLLLERGAEPDLADVYYHATPITWAAYNGHVEAVKLLVAAGARPRPALGMAVLRDRLEVVEALLASGRLPLDTLGGFLAMARSGGKAAIAMALERAGVEPPPPAVAQLDPAILARYVGRYASEDGLYLTVVRGAGGALQARFLEQPALTLGAVDATRFRPPGLDALSLTFQVEAGKVSGVVFDQAGAEIAMRRVGEGDPDFRAEGLPPPASSASGPRSPAWTLSALLPAGSAARNWPSFRGPGASGTAEGARPPLAWSAETGHNVRWKTPIPGLGHASPIVWGDRVVVATAVHLAGEPAFRHGLYGDVDTTTGEGEISWRLVALERASGRVRWEREAARATPRVQRHLKASHANSTPATDGRTIVAFFGSEGGLHAFDLEGRRRWRTEVGAADTGWFYDPSYQWGHGSSPVIWEGRVILQVDQAGGSFLAAYDLADGHELWRTPRHEIASWGTPTVVGLGGAAEVVANGSRAVRGYDAVTGRELWSLGPTAALTVSTPVAAHGLVYVSNGYRLHQSLYAIRPGGRGDLSLPGPAGAPSGSQVAWSRRSGGTYIPTPIVVGDQLYTLDNTGTLTCYDAATGEERYRRRVGGGRAAFSASPVAAEGRLYLASEDGAVYVIKAGPAYEPLAVNSLAEVILATPALSGDLLIVRTRRHLWALREGSE